jgi:hypothetical protein
MVMARFSASRTALLLAGALLAGSSLGLLQSCVEARAVATKASRIEQVRLGFGLDLEGKVSPGCAASSFAMHDPIHLSMRISQAPAGSVVRVSVRDIATRRVAWSEEKPVPASPSYLTFEIGRNLAEGRYRADSTLGDETASTRDFLVHVWHGNAH